MIIDGFCQRTELDYKFLSYFNPKALLVKTALKIVQVQSIQEVVQKSSKSLQLLKILPKHLPKNRSNFIKLLALEIKPRIGDIAQQYSA